ncbi:MAG: serine hydrolase domain-containing protein [Actinomycetota bacterium]
MIVGCPRGVRFVLLAVAATLGVVLASCSSGSTTDAADTADGSGSAPSTESSSPETDADDTAADADAEVDAAAADEGEAGDGGADDASSDQTEDAADPADEADSAALFATVTETVDAFVADRGLEGAGLIVVDAEDGVLYEQYFGTFSADRISMIASASKMISAGVLLRLQDDGLLDLDAPVERVVDWGVGNPEVTPAQLVSNSSGLVGLGPDLLYAPYLCQWAVEGTLQQCGETVFTSANDDEDQIAPDTEFRYGGAQWQVAGAVAEAASGRSWAQLIQETYVEPCGVDSLGYLSLGALPVGLGGYPDAFGGDPDSVTPSDNPNIEGGAYITVADYGALLLMHLRGGRCDDQQVLSQAALDAMHGDRIAAAYGGDAWSSGTGYGMGWWVDRESGRINDPGAWGAFPWLDLDDGYGAYIVVEDRSATGQALADEIEELVHQAVTGR